MKPKVINKKVLVAIIALALFGLVLWNSYAQAQQPPKEVVWAVVDALSGPYAGSSKEGVNAMEMFLEENKYTIAGYKIKLVLADTELNPAVGVRRVTEVISANGDRLVVVFSGASSAVQLAMSDLISKRKGPLFWTDGWDSKLTGQMGNRYTFRWASPNYTIAQASLTGFLNKFPEIKKTFTLMVDYAWGYDMWDCTKPILEERKIVNLKTQWIPVTATDASAFVTEAKASGADAYIIGLYGNIMGTTITQAHEFNLKEKMKVFSMMGTLNVLRGIGSTALNGMYLADHWTHALNNEWSRAFTKKYKERWGIIPSDIAAERYMAAHLTQKAMEKTRSADFRVIIPALEKVGDEGFEGPTGKEYMPSWSHQVEHDFMLLRAKSPGEKKYEDDFVEVIGAAKVYPKKGSPGYQFDRSKEPL